MSRLNISFGPGPDDVTINGRSNMVQTAADLDRCVAFVNEARAGHFKAIPGLVAVGRSKNPSRIRLGVKQGDKVEWRELIDLHAAFGATGLGNGNPELCKPVARQILAGTTFMPATIAHPLELSVLEAIRQIAEMPDGVVFFGSDGHFATNIAVLASFNYHCRQRGLELDGADPRWAEHCIVVAENCYHGSGGFGRAFLTNPKVRVNFGPLVANILKVPYGDIYALEALFAKSPRPEIAGVMLERVQGAGGCIAPPDDYIARAGELCRTYGATFIVDDVKGGLGRLGDFLACPSSGVPADIVCGGKLAGAGIMPFSFTIGKPTVMEGFTQGTFGLTCVAEPAQCMSLLAVLKLLDDELGGKPSLLSQVREKAKLLEVHFQELKERWPSHIVKFDGKGLMRALETTLPGKDLAEMLRELGVYTTAIERHPRRVYVAPPLTITDSEIHIVATTFAAAIADLVARQ